MQRVYESKDDEKFANRWQLINVIVYSTVALMIVLISAHLPASRAAGPAGLAGLSGPAPGFQKGGLHTRSQSHTALAARQAPTVVAYR